MTERTPFIVAEAAQGYEGSVDIAKLLVRAAAKAKADAVKFQVIYADELAVPGYTYYSLFRQLEMPDEAWTSIRADAEKQGVGFFIDVFGGRSLELARRLSPDGIKLHSTTFFDDELTRGAKTLGKRLFFSVGGIDPAEIQAFAERHRVADIPDAVLLFGYQAEPTPLDRNNLARIASLRDLLGVEVGFMDHVDAASPDAVTLSAMALALGVRVFEKHVTLDRALELEDYVSALPPAAFADYVSAIRRLAGALGSADLALSEEELGYRGRALKRVVAARDLSAGQTLAAADFALLRPAAPGGLFDPAQAIGRKLVRALAKGEAVSQEGLA